MKYRFDGTHTFEDGTQAPFYWTTRKRDGACSWCVARTCRQKVIVLHTEQNPEAGDLIVHCGPEEFS